jgi:hypothetical protein
MKEDTTPIDPTWMEKTGGYARDMTLRDHYAGLAMQALLGDDVRNFDLLAIEAYQMADAMLAVKQSRDA